ncbi:methyltransferase [Halomarina ordinaria]|uniref:Methyltransferase n=1 Tax=Halomarina ordinaria TaxID=3033939 RepID=A0ABD5U3B1_9EURY|nr:methyltransferase [Halomarina sp. PSRA2]
MPVVPTALERVVLLGLNRGPGATLDLVGAAGARAVATAIDLGVFEALRDGPLSLPELARATGTDEAGLSVLVGFLDRLGYVTRHRDLVENTPMTTRWLVAGETDVGPWLTFWNDLVFAFWDAHLETAVREGAPPQTIYEWFDEDPERWRAAQSGFLGAARVVVPEFVRRTDLGSAHHLLDVGGGHGLFAAAFCRAHPGLRATVFDRVPALDLAREVAAAVGVSDRVQSREGDYFRDDLGSGYDVALVCNVLHAHTADENRRLLARVADAIALDGEVVVLDQFGGSAPTSLGQTALAFEDLNYLVTLGGHTHDAADVSEWLTDAGFGPPARTDLRTVPGVSVLRARRAA